MQFAPCLESKKAEENQTEAKASLNGNFFQSGSLSFGKLNFSLTLPILIFRDITLNLTFSSDPLGETDLGGTPEAVASSSVSVKVSSRTNGGPNKKLERVTRDPRTGKGDNFMCSQYVKKSQNNINLHLIT